VQFFLEQAQFGVLTLLGGDMSLYLGRAKYSPEGLKGLLAKPEDRTAAARALYEATGAKLLHLWFSASTGEAISVFEATSTAGMSVGTAMMASGAFTDGSVEELMTGTQQMEVMKGAANIVSRYRAPGK